MKTREIDLSSLTKRGMAKCELNNGTLYIRTERSITSVGFNHGGGFFRKHCASVPGTFKVPFRLDMEVKLSYPGFLLAVGSGHISFSSPLSDNRKVEDIAFPSGKPNQDGGIFDNYFPPNEWVNISVAYGIGEMFVFIGGEERFYTNKLAYMSARRRKEFDELNERGFEIGLTVSKLSELGVKSISVTEYDIGASSQDERPEGKRPRKPKADSFDEAFRAFPVKSALSGLKELSAHLPSAERPKPTFDGVLSSIPGEFKDEARKTDEFLKSLSPMKFKRTLDRGGSKISYVASDYGFSYHIEAGGKILSHRFSWYIVTNGKPETWHRRADYMEEALAHISKTDKKLAERIVTSFSDCIGCFGGGCLGRTTYEYGGKKYALCHGTVLFRMSHDDFNDAREFIRILNELMAGKDELPAEKIYVLPQPPGE